VYHDIVILYSEYVLLVLCKRHIDGYLLQLLSCCEELHRGMNKMRSFTEPCTYTHGILESAMEIKFFLFIEKKALSIMAIDY